jgi:hypothetical protein
LKTPLVEEFEVSVSVSRTELAHPPTELAHPPDEDFPTGESEKLPEEKPK